MAESNSFVIRICLRYRHDSMHPSLSLFLSFLAPQHFFTTGAMNKRRKRERNRARLRGKIFIENRTLHSFSPPRSLYIGISWIRRRSKTIPKHRRIIGLEDSWNGIRGDAKVTNLRRLEDRRLTINMANFRNFFSSFSFSRPLVASTRYLKFIARDEKNYVAV